MIGTVIAERYAIDSEIGRGGMAVVYRARDLRLNRPVAIKILHPHLASQEESAARFVRESQAIAKLNHPNIIEIYDASRDPRSKSHFLVMELVEGPTLKDFLDAHPLDIPELGLAMVACLCDALQHAHDKGIIHRDIKPENIMIDGSGTLKLMDFGIARILDTDRMTASGSLLGSPAHMPPEIIEGQPYSYTCDIFSMGTVLYYTMTNLLPFRGETPVAVFKAILDGRYLPPSRIKLTISRECDRLVAKCLAIDPKDRYQTAALLKADICSILESVNFQTYADEIKAYYQDPAAYHEAMVPAILERFNQNALEQVKARRIPLAVDLLNRVLSYDPDNATARETLIQIRRSNLRMHIARGLVLATLLIAMTWMTYDYLQSNNTTGIAENDESSNALEVQDGKLKTEALLTIQANAQDLSTNAQDLSTLNRFSQADLEPKTKEGSALHAYLVASLKPLDIFSKTENAQDNAGQGEGLNDVQPNTILVAQDAQQPSRRPVRTPKNNSVAKIIPTQADTQTPTTAPENAALSNVVTPKTSIHIIQPVFPPDAFAIIAGQRYDADASGDIHLDLEPGNYKMTLNCHERCVKQTQTLSIKAGETQKTFDIISLPWADAKITLTPPSDQETYFVARRLDDKNHRILHLVGRTPNSIGGFNAFGRPIQLEVYAIPKARIVTSYEASELERAKLASTRLALSPGESRSHNF